MIPVVIESPLAGPPKVMERNLAYARACLHDSLLRGEAPFASHLLYPQCLDDNVPEERELGIGAGFAWGCLAETRIFYVDRGFSSGMTRGLVEALCYDQKVVERSLGGQWALKVVYERLWVEPEKHYRIHLECGHEHARLPLESSRKGEDLFSDLMPCDRCPKGKIRT